MTKQNFKEYRTIDKSKWHRGPWDNEPDKVQWIDEETGLDCLIVRNHSGAWCGYCAVGEKHPMYKAEYDDCHLLVHGGLTYSAFCQHGGEESGICHIPATGRPDNVWWLGFDCAHSGDLSPSYSFERSGRHETYKDQAYVTKEVEGLAKQLNSIVAVSL